VGETNVPTKFARLTKTTAKNCAGITAFLNYRNCAVEIYYIMDIAIQLH